MAEEAVTVSGVAERYAAALFDLARDEKALDAVAKDLASFQSLLDESDDLTRLVRSPVFSSDEQTRAIAAILDKAGIKGLAANLIKVAAANRRLFAVPEMIVAYRRMLSKERGEVFATVTSAEFDVLRDEAEVYAEKLRAAGNQVTLHRVNGTCHGYAHLIGMVPEADETAKLLGGILKKALQA